MTDAIVTIPSSTIEGTPRRVVLTHKHGQTTVKVGDVVISHGFQPHEPVEAIEPCCDRPAKKLASVPPGKTESLTNLGVTIEHKPTTSFHPIFIRKK